MADDLHIRSLLEKLYREGLSPAETEALHAFLRTKQGERLLHAFMDEKALETFDESAPIDEACSSEILDRLQSSVRQSAKRPSRKVGREFTLHPVARIAASFAGIVLLVLAGVLAYQRHQTVTHATGIGEKETIILPDLSTVTLDGNSSLTFSRDWKDEALREVVLRGEAYFSVTKSKTKPFIVHASDVDIRVLGTTFTVKNYDDESVEASLLEGSIAIRSRAVPGADDIILSPNQKATFLRSSQRITLSQVAADAYTVRESRKLVFDDERFEEILKSLERKYGVRIELQDRASKDCRFSATIQYESLKEVLDLFASTTDLSYSISGKAIEITGRLCPTNL